MSTIEYLSLSKPRRMLVSFGRFFVNLFLGIGRFFKRIPKFFAKMGRKIANPIYVLIDAAKNGNWVTRMNFIVMGFAQYSRKQIAKGVLFTLFEIVFIVYMILVGGPNLGKLGTLGNLAGYEVGGTSYAYDNSFTILLYSIITFIVMLIGVALYYFSIRDAKNLQDHQDIGKLGSNGDFARSLADEKYHVVLLTIPMIGLAIFTVVPIVFMIIVGFTNYASPYRDQPVFLFDWVGFYNYASMLGGNSGVGAGGGRFLEILGQVLLWTLIWAFFATFSNYFLGMVMAILIKKKGIKLKKLWRTILVSTIAVPQFVSLLLISKMLNTEAGFINSFLKSLNIISDNIKWLDDPILAKVTIIVVNTWIGIPYTMLTCTGILMNIPEDLYESARIDGASPFKMYMKITLPYMLFVTGPYLISSFVGNINNFNVIYLLSGGNPKFLDVPPSISGVGQTDILITLLYKMTMTSSFKDYGASSVLGVLIFIVIAVLSLITYSRSGSVKNEEDFQ